MPTKKRIWIPGAIYHLTARGNNKNAIFKSRVDFLVYLRIIRETLEYYEYKYELLCYCLMTNHVHIQVKANEKHISYFIGRINSTYAKYYNSKYDFCGHLFQGRYFSEIIKDDEQMLETSRYIHLNPVRAHMVNKPEEYEWSSYSMYIKKCKVNVINPKLILWYFNDNENAYKKFVENVSTPGVH